MPGPTGENLLTRPPSGGAPDPQLVEMFRGMRQDARSDPKPAELAEPFVIQLGFDGAVQLPLVGSTVIIELGLINARVTGATIVANGVGSATIDLRHGTYGEVPNLPPMYGVGAMPALVSAAVAILDTSTWTINIQPFDVLMATLMSVSGGLTGVSGSLTSLVLSLHCRRLKWSAGTANVISNSGSQVVSNAGNLVIWRSP